MTIDTIQKKNIKEYNKYKNKAIIKPVINSRLPQQALWCLLFMIMLVSQYSCKKVDYVDSNVIYGSLSYNNIVKGLQSLPSGQKVDVFFNDSLSTINSFTTTEIGKYNFIPTVKGNYNFEFKFTDTLLQYNNALVEKPDIDTLRPSSSYPVVYQFKTNPAISVDKKDNSFQQNVTLQIKETGIRLQMVDENEHPISNAKVCIYANQQFAAANAPYCGGCLAYLSSDINGNVFFVGLQAQSYYLNARARIGVVSLSNQYADEMKTTGAIQAGVISSKKIILK